MQNTRFIQFIKQILLVMLLLGGVAVFLWIFIGVFLDSEFLSEITTSWLELPAPMRILQCTVLGGFVSFLIWLYWVSFQRNDKDSVLKHTKMCRALPYWFWGILAVFCAPALVSLYPNKSEYFDLFIWTSTAYAFGTIAIFYTQMRYVAWIESSLKSEALVNSGGRLFRSISNPVYTSQQVKHMDGYCLFLRPFAKDSKNYGGCEKLLDKIGKQMPVLAIGQPGTIVQSYVAARIYATDEEWKDTVSTLSANASLIVYSVGDTDGFSWELELCKRENYIHKSVFVVKNDKEARFLENYIDSCFCNSPIGERTQMLYRDSESGLWKLNAADGHIAVGKCIDILHRCFDDFRNICKENAQRRKHWFRNLFVSKNGFRQIFSLKDALFGLLFPCVALPYYANHRMPFRVIAFATICYLAMAAVIGTLTNDDYSLYWAMLPISSFFMGIAQHLSLVFRPWSSKEAFLASHRMQKLLYLDFVVVISIIWLIWTNLVLY